MKSVEIRSHANPSSFRQRKESSTGNPERKRANNTPAHLFILAGQSNMVGLDPEISFTPAVKKAFGAESVIVVKDAHNSQPISRWVKGWKSAQGKSRNVSGDIYGRMIGRVNDAVAGRDLETVTLVWMQGEADAAGNQVPVYKASLDGLLEQLKQDLKRDDIRFVLGRLSDYSLDTGKHPQWQAMRDLQVAYAEASPLRDWVDTDDLNNKIDSKTRKPKNDVHYTKEGYRIFGQRLAEKAIGLIPQPAFPGVKSDFRGYDRYDRIKTSAGHFAVVCPRNPAPGKPWLWRSLFWEAIKKVSDADLKLVDEGYHVVLAHGDVAGHPSGNANIDAAYRLLTTEYGFSKKCANMSSMSRGTLSLFRWASANPNKVDSIYVDNGVCNVLSWPAGKLVPGSGSKASGAPSSWEDFKRKFGYTTDAEAIKTKESPIDQLEPLARAGVPILMVCGDKDHAVPYEENDAIMEQRYQALGGNIRVIVENKGHSHGMNDPTPLLEFIRKHTSAEPTATDQSSAEAVSSGKTIAFSGQEWIVDTQNEWQSAIADQSNLEIKDGVATPTADEASFRSVLITSDKKRSAKSLTIEQSPVWHNWNPISNLGPSNLGDAPVTLTVGPGNYWMFGRYGRSKKKDFKPETATLEGFDVPLKTTPFPNQFDAPGGLKKGLGGCHAWQSRDMINWVHHGPVSESFSSWVTTAEYADGKLYLYYDYPNDQDPHLYIDDDLTDGVPGRNHGMAFKDPSHGSDCAFIRDLRGNFHVIYEDWSPIDASTHSWDSPLAGHAISKTGVGDFKILPPAVDVRTKPTGKFAEYPHPHWHATDPKNYPGKPAPEDVPQHRIRKGDVRAFARYEIHQPEQDAFGDWASICVGGRYYLFADYHPAGKGIRVGWFTSSSLDKPFTFCGEIGKGHPDPDIMFAEGRFYLATQMSRDYVSPGPWVETVKARVGVDIDNNDQWTDWTEVNESYDYINGFSKQIAKSPAKLDLDNLPEGYGFQFELRLNDSTENASKPVIEQATLSFK
ncbi:MAG: sialate O-acetylesterase [Planctomycetota bacterium]